MVFSGVQRDVKIADLSGWTMFFRMPYSSVSRIDDLRLPSKCGGNALLVAARQKDFETLLVAALGLADNITKSTRDTVKATGHNGAFWYLFPGYSFGFSSVERIHLNTADVAEQNSPDRLSWHLDGRGEFRAGSLKDLNHKSDIEKVLFWGVLHEDDLAC